MMPIALGAVGRGWTQVAAAGRPNGGGTACSTTFAPEATSRAWNLAVCRRAGLPGEKPNLPPSLAQHSGSTALP